MLFVFPFEGPFLFDLFVLFVFVGFFGFVLFDFVRFGITHKKHFDPDSGSVFFSPRSGGRRAISLMSL